MKSKQLAWLMVMFLGLSVEVLAQQKPSKQQQAELDKAVKEAEAEMAKLKDPAYINKMFDDQIKEFKAKGQATPELLREFEKARAEMLKMAKGVGAPAPAQPEEPSEPTETVSPAPKPVEQPVPTNFDEVESPYSKVPSSFQFYRESEVTVETFAAFMQKKYGVQVRKQETVALPTGSKITTFQQFIEDYPVFGAYFKVRHESNGKALFASGDAFDGEMMSKVALKPSFSKEKSIQVVVSKVTTVTTAPKYEQLLVIPERLMPSSRKFQLVHQISHDDILYFVDAQSGQIVHRLNHRSFCWHSKSTDDHKSIAQINTNYYGFQKIKTFYDKDTKMYMLSSHDTPYVVVIDTNQKVPTRSDNEWNRGEYRVKGILDAAFSGQKVVEFYQSQLGQSSFDNKGTQVGIRRVPREWKEHYRNAFWSKDHNLIYFGYINGNPLATVDIVGHEFTHGLVSYTANLLGQSESGALNEGIADMLGTAVEHWAQVKTPDWLIASEVILGGIRNMKSPKTLTDTERKGPNTYEGEFWIDTNGCVPSEENDDCGEHINSTVASHWFYLLSEGGKGTNDHKQMYNIEKGIGIQKAAKLVYQTLFSLTPYTNFERFAEATVKTAEQMFGKCATETHRVKHAWYAVGVFEDAPARCMDLTFDWTYDPEPDKAIRFYVKGDSIVSVARTEEGWVKTYSERNSAFMHIVSKDEEGVKNLTLPKNWAGTIYNKMEEIEPVMEEMNEEALEKAKAELRNPATSPERKAELKEVIPQVEKYLAEGRKAADETKKNLKELSDGTHLTSEAVFWGGRKGKREFDKENIKGSYLYQGKYVAKRYVLKGGISWESTTEIPLRLSDLGLFVPLNTGQLRMGVDHFMRGFPLKMFGGVSARNIKETIPANFNTLFSPSPVFN